MSDTSSSWSCDSTSSSSSSTTMDIRSVKEERIPSPNMMTVTNFSISEILKPDFGIKSIKTNVIQQNFCYKPRVESPINFAFRDKKTHHKPSTSSPNPNRQTQKEKFLESKEESLPDNSHLYPAWVFCTRYSDRPTSGPRSRSIRRKRKSSESSDDKRPRVAFTTEQLQKLKVEFDECKYLTETRRHDLAKRLNLSESQIKIWFQNKRAKLKKSVGSENPLQQSLRCQGLYNHTPAGE